MLANFLSGVENKTIGSSELKKKNERDHKSKSDPSILTKLLLLKTGSLGSLPIQNCYLYQRKLPCDREKKRPRTTRDKHVRMEDHRM